MLVLRAFERAASVVVDANLTIVGDGPLMEAVQETIRRRQISNRVRLIPNAEPSLVRELLLQTRVFVIASEREGLSNALIEAMATRKVIVASSNDSHREILRNGHEALLFRIDDEQDLTELMISALTDEQLGERLSTSAQELCARQFSSTKLGPRLEKIYWTVVRKITLIPAED
jgi:glycosyltransferase involved in cell wall biosynthesis